MNADLFRSLAPRPHCALIAAAAPALRPRPSGKRLARGPGAYRRPLRPGLDVDIIARIVGDKLAKRDRPADDHRQQGGRERQPGTDATLARRPTGTTIARQHRRPARRQRAGMFKKMPHDAAMVIELVSIAATQPSVPSPGDARRSSTDELVALMKKNPGKYNYASMAPAASRTWRWSALATARGHQRRPRAVRRLGPRSTALLAGNPHRGAAGGGGDAADQGRQDQGARGGDGKAIGGLARAADACRKRAQGHPGRRLDGLRRVRAKTPDADRQRCTAS